jgi:radical SAM protein with 4Fe4S-binding SPASM domain
MTYVPERVRHLPIAPFAEPGKRHLPLASQARLVDQEARPLYTVWELTLRCDMTCAHCGSRAGRARPDELDLRQALDVVRQLKDLGNQEVTLIGGEAYLHPDWVQIGQAIRDAGMRLTMVTGGRGMTKERAQMAKEAGVFGVGVSVDALEPLHDRLRSPGSYQAALSAIRNLVDVGIKVSTNTQITRPALRDIEPMVQEVIQAGVDAWQVSMTVPMGRAADDPHLILQPYQVLEVLPMIARIEKQVKEQGVRVVPGNDIGYFGPYEQQLRGESALGHRQPCTAGRLTLGIEANGAIKGCPSLPSKDYVGGNLRDNSLQEIWERSEALRFTRNRNAEDLWGYCRTCYYAEDCLAGCSWTAHVLFGKIGNNPFCHHRALELLAEGKREVLVPVAPAQGNPFDYGLFDCIVEPWPAEELVAARLLVERGIGWLS